VAATAVSLWAGRGTRRTARHHGDGASEVADLLEAGDERARDLGRIEINLEVIRAFTFEVPA
jgi:hypothetical protein